MLSVIATMILTLTSLEIVTATDIEVGTSKTSTDGAIYQLGNKSGIGYEVKSMIQQLEKVTHVACILSCNRFDGCDHVIFDKDVRKCTLVREVVSVRRNTGENRLTNSEMIFSRNGMLYREYRESRIEALPNRSLRIKSPYLLKQTPPWI